ncbi:hypothetical protein IT568_02795 [bacterium]|nr:hypothetical protein [bacterium]
MLTYKNSENDFEMDLAFNCPFAKEGGNCPLKDFRNLDSNERFNFFAKLKTEELRNLLTFHFSCLDRQKEESINNENFEFFY